MACRSDRTVCLAAALAALLLSGCVSLQVQKVRQGAELVAPAGLTPGVTSLQEVLSRCGAPDEIVDLDPDYALHYRHTLQRGANISVGIPLKYVWLPNPSVEARGNLQRYDAAVLIFTADGVLKDLRYEKATERPLIRDYW